MEMLEERKKDKTVVQLSKRMKKRLISLGLVLVLVLGMFLIGWLSGRSSGKAQETEKIAALEETVEKLEKELQEMMDTPIVTTVVAPEIVIDIIEAKAQAIAELATMEYIFTNSGKFTDSKQISEWNIPFTEKSFILKWDGTIKAGVNLDGVGVEVQEAEKRIVISIPEATILSYTVDRDSTEVLDERDSIFNRITIADQVDFEAATEAEMVERAIQSGLLEKAQKNAETILRSLIVSDPAVASAYEVEFVVLEAETPAE